MLALFCPGFHVSVDAALGTECVRKDPARKVPGCWLGKWLMQSRTCRPIVAGQRAITGETALRLGRYFDTTPDYWINLQARYDLDAARDAWESRIASEVTPHQAA
jgi:hypothetical protein